MAPKTLGFVTNHSFPKTIDPILPYSMGIPYIFTYVKYKLIYLALSLTLVALLGNEMKRPTPPPIGPYLNGIFSETTPGEVGSWEAEDAFPNIQIPAPLRLSAFPGTEDYLILSKLGIIYRVNFENQTQKEVLNITDRAFKLGESGTTGIALHPEFGNPNSPDKQQVFIFYRYKANPDIWEETGFNRVSKFTWDASSEVFSLDSEEVLIQQYDRSTWHNGGGMFFGEDGLLYISVGDEGKDRFQVDSNQNIELGFFGGLLRIDVDNDSTRSHPIRRQPDSKWDTQGTGDNFSQGYMIPNDNPWLNTEGSTLEEFYAVGLRSPYSTFLDKMENQIWCLDVGTDRREEVSKINKADNLQWPYMEGTLESEVHEKPTDLIGNEKAPIFEYDRSVGQAIIAGGIYRGSTFPSLFGKLLMADYISNKVMALSVIEGMTPELNILIPNLENLGLALPHKPGITGILILDNGDILISVMETEDHSQTGKILRLKQNVILPDPPSKLSELGVFTDLDNLETIEGVIPYSVNAPLWSDRAQKKRWMIVPDNQQIKFSNSESWAFPEGTVFIKHFDLPITTDEEGPVVKLETRFFILGKNNTAYGLTYQWNEEGTDANLLRVGAQKTFDITEGGQVAFQQTWDYPSRDQCLSCHNNNAKYVLGVNTQQLNGTQYYHNLGMEMNQLEYLSDQHIIDQEIIDPELMRKSYHISDASVDLELRIRSYLDSNCASCHRLGGIPMVNMDLRSRIPLNLSNLINAPTQSRESDQNRLLVKPGDHSESELWIRDASEGSDMMPPLARNLVDEVYVAALAEWIDGLPEDAGKNEEFILFPNPSDGNLILRLSDSWETPIKISLYSITGELVWVENYDTKSIYLELSDFPAGTYILEGITGENKILEKVVFQ